MSMGAGHCIVLLVKRVGLTKEPLLKGKVQYSWPPLLINLWSIAFIYFFCKTSYLNEEAYCIEPLPLISVPWLDLYISKQLCLLEGLRSIISLVPEGDWLESNPWPHDDLSSTQPLRYHATFSLRWLLSEVEGLVQLTSSLRYLAL